MRILVVEDEPTLAAQLAEGIKSVGYVVDVAHNGVDGHFMGKLNRTTPSCSTLACHRWMASRYSRNGVRQVVHCRC
jgi:DNA-binding response OmpR family regulator